MVIEASTPVAYTRRNGAAIGETHGKILKIRVTISQQQRRGKGIGE
jgi:hypothetical protein